MASKKAVPSFRQAHFFVREGAESFEIFSKAAALLVSLGLRASAQSVAGSFPGKLPKEVSQERKPPKGCDLGIVIGGDGSVLGAAPFCAPFNIPIAAIHTGRVGFLADIPAARALRHLKALVRGEFTSESRMMIEAALARGGKELFRGLALNDVAITRSGKGIMAHLRAHVDDSFLFDIRSDGLVISSPTGSTAYSLAAGGPIIHPLAESLTLTPVCPQNLANRPIVLPAASRVFVDILQAADLSVFTDGRNGLLLEPGDQIAARKGLSSCVFLHPRGHDHYETLRGKLGWNSR